VDRTLKKPEVDLARLRRYRLGRVREVMAEADVALCILVNPISLRYAADFREYATFQAHIPTYYLFVPVAGPLVLHGSYAGSLETVDEHRPPHYLNCFDGGLDLGEHARRFALEVKDFLRETGGASARSRVAVEHVNPSATHALTAAGLEVIDAEGLMEQARWIKSPEELVCLRHSIRVAEAGLGRMQDRLAPGITENQLWSMLHQVNVAHDGDWIDGRMLCSGARTNPWYQEASDKVIAAGELVALDSDMIGPFGYCADISRTWLCPGAGPTARQRDLYRRAYDEIQHNMALIKPGVSFRELSERAFRQPEEFVAHRYACLAHGVGMSDEYPKIAYRQDWERIGYDGAIPPASVLSVESFTGSEQGGEGVKLEEMVLVTAEGCERLSRYAFEDALLS
jgi:Xaa-Pro aminopeptidase